RTRKNHKKSPRAAYTSPVSVPCGCPPGLSPCVRVDEWVCAPHNRRVSAPISAPNPSYRSIYRAGLFEGKLVIVTGGGSGIGRCTAPELASLGAAVALLGRTKEKLEASANEITEDGGSASTHLC